MSGVESAILDFGKKRLPEPWLLAFRTWSWSRQDDFFRTLYYMRYGEHSAKGRPLEECHKYAWDKTMEALDYPMSRDATAMYRFGIAIKRPFPGSPSSYY